MAEHDPDIRVCLRAQQIEQQQIEARQAPHPVPPRPLAERASNSRIKNLTIVESSPAVYETLTISFIFSYNERLEHGPKQLTLESVTIAGPLALLTDRFLYTVGEVEWEILDRCV